MRTDFANAWPCCIPARRGAWSAWCCCPRLSKLAASIGALKRPEVAALPEPERAAAVGEQTFSISNLDALADMLHGRRGRTFSISNLDTLADRFTAAEAERLERRFAPLHARILTETEQFVPGFQSGPSRYRFEHMPPDFEVDDFIATWSEAA